MKLLSLLALTLLVSQCFSHPINTTSLQMEASRDKIHKRDTGNQESNELSSDASTEHSDKISRALQPTPENSTTATSTPNPNEPQSNDSTPTASDVVTCPPPVQLGTALSDTNTSAHHTSQAAWNLRQYIKYYILDGQEPGPQPPCFLIERQVSDGRTHPRINYKQRFVEDFNSVKGFYSYIMLVQRSLMQNMTSDGYRIHFTDLITTLVQLKNNMSLVLQSINPEEYGEEEGSALQDYCYDTGYEQQLRRYSHLSALSGSAYIQMDIKGLLDTVKK